jgi:signal transduction histidine kinase
MVRGRVLTALGLRGRIVGVVLATAVAALAVAAVVLLGPLEHSLRNADLATLKQQVRQQVSPAYIGSLKRADPSVAVYGRNTPTVPLELRQAGERAKDKLLGDERVLYLHTAASEVALLSYADAAGRNPSWVVPYPDRDLVGGDLADDAALAFLHPHHGAYYSLGSINGTEVARAAIPFTTTESYGSTHYRQRWVLIVRKSLVEVSAAVAAVRTAFLVAALVALALALLLGIPLSARIVRRLRALRQAALRLAEGRSDVQVPVDRVLDEVGDLARAFLLMRDQLRQQEEARRAFVATASHELRTPLATLEGMLELLEEELRSESPDLVDAHGLLERARAQSHRLGRLAADLLDLSRLDAQVELRSEPIELSELSRAVLAEFELGISGRRISTTLDDALGPVWAMADPGSVARIVRILVDNAVRLSPEGSHVNIELRNGEHASLSVCDQGPGVLAEERELIFERFMRGRQTAGQGGFGLGLAIGRELAERMGGELVLEDHHGSGARFTLSLPLAQAPDEEPVVVG